MELFVEDFSTTMQVRMLIFDMQVDDDLLYRKIENQLSPAYSSLRLFNFLSFHTLKEENFRQRFLWIVQARVVIFGIRLILMCCIVGLRPNLFLLILPYICPIFFFPYFE